MLKDAKEMRAITMGAQEYNNRKKFKNTLKKIKQRAKKGEYSCTVSFHRDKITDTQIQAFVNYLTSKGYKVFVDGVHIMRIEW